MAFRNPAVNRCQAREILRELSKSFQVEELPIEYHRECCKRRIRVLGEYYANERFVFYNKIEL